jgi:hypothetical protein
MSSEPSHLHRKPHWQGLAPFAVAFVGCLMSIAAFFPGYMSPDSLFQLIQGRTNEFADWHPPLMAWIWGKLDALWAGPAPMLVVHNIFFWLGATLLFSVFLRSYWVSSTSVLFLGFFPSVLLLLSTIWKDIGMASCFLFGIGLLAQLQLQKSLPQVVRKLFYIAIFISFFVAIGLRHNALPAVVPLLFWLMYLCLSSPVLQLQKWKHIGICFTAALGIAVAIFLVNGAIGRILTNDKTTFPIQQILLHDLLSISVRTEQNLLPAFTYMQHGDAFNFVELKKLYNPHNVVQFYDSGEGRKPVKNIVNAEDFQILKESWVQSVTQYPGKYLRGRFETLNYMLAFWNVPTCYSYHAGIEGNEYKIAAPKWNNSVHKRYSFFDGTFLYRPWIYLALNFVCLLAMFKFNDPRKGIVAAVSLSGIFYTLPYLLVSTGCDFRLTWWTTCSAILSSLMCLGIAFTGWKKAALAN